MFPTLKPGQFVISFNWAYFFQKPAINELVVIKQTDKTMVKRIKKIKKGEIFVIGDNPQGSTDSRHFGWIKKDQIVGKIIYVYSY